MIQAKCRKQTEAKIPEYVFQLAMLEGIHKWRRFTF